jgi:hypothetical protein
VKISPRMYIFSAHASFSVRVIFFPRMYNFFPHTRRCAASAYVRKPRLQQKMPTFDTDRRARNVSTHDNTFSSVSEESLFELFKSVKLVSNYFKPMKVVSNFFVLKNHFSNFLSRWKSFRTFSSRTFFRPRRSSKLEGLVRSGPADGIRPGRKLGSILWNRFGRNLRTKQNWLRFTFVFMTSYDFK